MQAFVSLSFFHPQVLNNAVDFSLGMFSKTIARYQAMSTSMSYAQSPLIMIVPPGQEFSSFEKLLIAFDEPVWYVILGMMMVVVIATLLLKCQSDKIQDFVFGTQNRTPFLNIANVIVGLPIYKTPGRNFSRWMLMMFVLM